jgi:hypothetical protein
MARPTSSLLVDHLVQNRKRPELAVLTVDYVNEANSDVVARFQGRRSSMRLTG